MMYIIQLVQKKKQQNKNRRNLNLQQPDYYTENDNVATDYYVEDYETGENATYEEEPIYVETETMQGPDGTTYITNNYYGVLVITTITIIPIHLE